DPRRHPFARPGARDHAGAGRVRDPRSRVRSHQGAAGRHALQPVLDRHLGVALDRDGGRRGGAGDARARGAGEPHPRLAAADVRVEDGSVVGRGGSVTLGEVARAWYLQPQHLPPDVDAGGLEVTAGYRPARDAGTFSYATHAAAVAVDPDTGAVEVLDYVVVEDGGRLVNPMVVDGQVRGGVAQGIGTCLLERMPFDA